MFNSFSINVKSVLKVLFIIAVLLQTMAMSMALAVGLYLYSDSPCDEIELSRTTSPDNRTDAVLNGWHCGATTGVTQKLYFVTAGEPISAISTPALVENDLNIVNAVWLSPEEFLVTYRLDNLYMFYARSNKNLIYDLRIKRNN